MENWLQSEGNGAANFDARPFGAHRGFKPKRRLSGAEKAGYRQSVGVPARDIMLIAIGSARSSKKHAPSMSISSNGFLAITSFAQRKAKKADLLNCYDTRTSLQALREGGFYHYEILSEARSGSVSRLFRR